MLDTSTLDAARDEDVRRALHAIRRLVRALRIANGSAEKSTGLSAAQLFVLDQVAANPGASLGELATLTLTDRSSVAAVTEKLLARGLLERRRSSTDRRRVEIFPTTQGTETLRHAPHPPTRLILDGLESLDDDRLERIASGLESLVTAMGLVDEPNSMLFEN